MTNETKNRIRAYMEELPHMKEKVFGALLMFVVAAVVVVSATYAWLTLSRSPEISEITTTLAANGALEIALSKPDGTMPDELDIDESLISDVNVTISNLQWGNLVNLSDASYGIDNLALRPAQLNTTSLLNSPLWGAVYGGDGRITNLDSNYAYAKFFPGTDGAKGQFKTSDEYGVRAIATYKTTIADATQQAYNQKVQAVVTAHTNVNQAYAAVAPKFSALGTMISKYAQDKLNSSYTNLAPYIADMIPLYEAVLAAMEAQKEAYVALANLQLYTAAQSSFTPLSWDDLYTNRAQYNTASAGANSSNGTIKLVGLNQFITDYNLHQADLAHLRTYQANYAANGSSYYWAGSYVDGSGNTVKDNSVSGYALSNIVAHTVDYASMTIDLNNDGNEVKVVSLGMDQAGALLTANGKERKVYAYNGILYRLEQSSIDEAYRINGKAACTINVKYSIASITVHGKAYTKASGACTFMENYSATLGTELVPNDAVAEDTYGLAIDLWVRTNAEETCLTLEGATSTDENGNIVSYDGINRIWGATGEAVLTNDSTTQGGGSCYVYYADTPEDMARSLDLLNAMKVAFVDSAGNLLATAEMDTGSVWAVNGRITVPLVLDNQTKTTYTYTDAANQVLTGYAITTLYTDMPIRVTAIVYLDGTRLTNDDVLAAAEIQGSLNIQFGSSVDLKTRGDNELIDDTRTVTATVSPEQLDYDTATSNFDMTTKVTVNIQGEGADPNKVTAFFVRAINSTQGSRERTMTFTKQANGAWTCDYLFTAPGTYYLRQVRLDGVDYTLADPQRVEVAGFGLSSVKWSELSNDVTVRTSEGTHTTSVTVQFASSDRSKLPVSVQARFVRDDGNTVNVPLTYNANGDWTGTGTFSASGKYQLQYLVANGNRYIDLAMNDGSYRTLDLSLGMYVTITDLSGGLNQEYDKDAEEGVYHKDIAVRVYNNAGVALEDLDDPSKADDMKLYFSNGTSLTNTVSTNLRLDEVDRCYIGTLPIVKPGRYQFAYVQVGGSRLEKCTESPVYTVISPDPPIYDENSAVTVNDLSGVQFVPLTNDAVIDGIRIADAEAASATAVVYSAQADSYYTVPMAYTGSVWSVNLPTYNGAQTGVDNEGNPIYEQIQEGKWSLAAIYLWNCYDENSQFREIIEDNKETTDKNEAKYNPILWVAEGELGQNYLNTLTGEKAITPDDTKDFSKLTTTVSGKVNVTMTAGTTALGSSADAFGTAFQISKTGMNVLLTDGADRVIPKDKITGVTLKVAYSGNSNTAYGYKVSDPGLTYTIDLNDQDAVSGERTVSAVNGGAADKSFWTYVGEYKVESLTVKIGEKTLTYAPGSNDVPAKYTVTTAAPTTDNIKLDANSVKQTVKEFGGTADSVTGTFLQAHDLSGTNVAIKLNGASGDMSYAVLEGLSTKLILTHKSGTSQTYGGYTFGGDTGYQNLSLTMSEKTAGSGVYYAPASQTLLAGVYTAKLEITAGGTTETVNLDNVIVWSVRPEVKITGVSPSTGTEITVNKNTDQANNHLTANAETFKAKNQYGDYYAVVYMGYAVGADWSHSSGTSCGGSDYAPAHVNDYANYTRPTVTFTLSNFGVNADSAMSIGNNEETASWTGGSTAATVNIGKIASETVDDGSHKYGGGLLGGESTCYYRCTIEKATPLGSANIETITTMVDGVTYTRTLASPLTISQLSQENPTLTWNAGASTTIKVTAGATTYTGTTDIPAMTSLTATVTANTGYHHPTLAEPENVSNWKRIDNGEDETKAVYTFQIAGNATLTGSATKYPAITFANANNAAVDVTVGGTAITSGTGGKTGGQVVVTVTADKDNGFCKPRLAQPTGITWTPNEGDFVSTYTFTMPDKAVSLSAPTTTAMYQVSWEPHAALRFVVKDGNTDLGNPSYVVPGHTLSIKLVATGGTNPKLDPLPDNVTEGEIGYDEANYTYTMNGDLYMKATAQSYPTVRVDTQYTSFTVESNNIDVTGQYAADGVSIKDGFVVRVVLTAVDGWYKPQMSQPKYVDEDGNEKAVSGWTKVKEGDWSSEYTFVMPKAAVDARGGITATAMKQVTLTASNISSLSMTYTGHNDTNLTTTKTGSVWVVPDSTVSVTVTEAANYYNPTVSGSGVTLTGGTVDTIYSTRTYTSAQITSDVTLTAGATAYPKVTVTTSNATVTGVTNNQQVRPGTTVSFTVTANDGYYISTSAVSNLTAASGDYAARSYSFTMGTANAQLTATATANPTIKYVEDGGMAGGSLSLNGTQMSNNGTISVRPGSSVRWNTNYGSNTKDRKTVFKKASDGTDFKTITSSGESDTGTITMPEYNLTVTAQSSVDGCVTPETLITLADGTRKRIDEVTYSDNLLVWDFFEGEYIIVPSALIVNHGYGDQTVIELTFDDGTVVRAITAHSFFDADTNKWELINADNAHKYVNHAFVQANGDNYTTVRLVEVSIYKEHTESYSLVSAFHYNFITENMFSLTNSVHDMLAGLVVGENMTYDRTVLEQDAEMYGQYTYADFADYITYEQYAAFNGAYLKISVEKGCITFDAILALIEAYL